MRSCHNFDNESYLKILYLCDSSLQIPHTYRSETVFSGIPILVLCELSQVCFGDPETKVWPVLAKLSDVFQKETSDLGRFLIARVYRAETN